ncbi:MAG: hypothetical protein ACTSRG_07830 [Candidatus Helarchaeota archaeon]
MPIGIILLDWDSSHGPVLKATYTETELDFDIEYLNIFLLHTATGWTEDKAQKQVFTQYAKYNLASRYVPIVENDVLKRVVIGIILNTHETKPDKYYDALEQLIKEPGIFSDDETQVTEKLKEFYEKNVKTVSYDYDITEVKKMIPLKTTAFRKNISTKVSELYESFGSWAIDFLEQLPQNLEVERLEGIFKREENAIAKLIIWANKNGLLRLVG